MTYKRIFKKKKKPFVSMGLARVQLPDSFLFQNPGGRTSARPQLDNVSLV